MSKTIFTYRVEDTLLGVVAITTGGLIVEVSRMDSTCREAYMGMLLDPSAESRLLDALLARREKRMKEAT